MIAAKLLQRFIGHDRCDHVGERDDIASERLDQVGAKIGKVAGYINSQYLARASMPDIAAHNPLDQHQAAIKLFAGAYGADPRYQVTDLYNR